MISELFLYLYTKGKIIPFFKVSQRISQVLLLIFNLEDRKEHQTIWPISFK